MVNTHTKKILSSIFLPLSPMYMQTCITQVCWMFLCLHTFQFCKTQYSALLHIHATQLKHTKKVEKEIH